MNPYFKFIIVITAVLKNIDMMDLEFLGYCIAYVSVAVISILSVIAYVKDRRRRSRKAKK